MTKPAKIIYALSLCTHCNYVIRAYDPGGPWGVASPGGDNTQCDKRPNPNDGPMLPHKPGSIVLNPNYPAPAQEIRP